MEEDHTRCLSETLMVRQNNKNICLFLRGFRISSGELQHHRGFRDTRVNSDGLAERNCVPTHSIDQRQGTPSSSP
jgi:hypothetical protein